MQLFSLFFFQIRIELSLLITMCHAPRNVALLGWEGGGLQGEPKFGYDLHEVGAKAYNNTSPFQKIRRDKNNQ